MNNNFCVKTFDGLLTTRSLTGITRIADHFLLNRVQMVARHKGFLIKQLYVADVNKVTDWLESLGGIVEVHRDNSDKPEDFFGEFMAYLMLDFQEDPKESRLEAMIHFIRSKASDISVSVYSTKAKAGLMDELASHLAGVIKDKPIQMTMVSGFTHDGQPISNIREIEKGFQVPVDCFYPDIPPIDELISGFSNSNNNLLFMISPAGCGKTSLVREICRRWRHKHIVQISGLKTLTHQAFDSFIATLADNTLCVIEDADILVNSRKEGNSSMDAFLNELNGIANRGIKFVITTNLENRKFVDEALLRPGRCYAVLDFRPLTIDECVVIVEHFKQEGESSFADIIERRIPTTGRITLAALLSDGGAELSKIGF